MSVNISNYLELVYSMYDNVFLLFKTSFFVEKIKKSLTVKAKVASLGNLPKEISSNLFDILVQPVIT